MKHFLNICHHTVITIAIFISPYGPTANTWGDGNGVLGAWMLRWCKRNKEKGSGVVKQTKGLGAGKVTATPCDLRLGSSPRLPLSLPHNYSHCSQLGAWVSRNFKWARALQDAAFIRTAARVTQAVRTVPQTHL